MDTEIEAFEGQLQVSSKDKAAEMDSYIIASRMYDKMSFPEIAEKVNEKFKTSYSEKGIHSRYYRAIEKRKPQYRPGLTEEEKAEVNFKLDQLIGAPDDEIRNSALLKVGYLDIETTGLFADFGYIITAVIKDDELNTYDVVRVDDIEGYYNPKVVSDPEFWKHVDKEILKRFLENFLKYDVIIHYNGKYFDMSFINTRMLKHGLGVLPPVKQIDIYQLAKREMKIRSKKQDALKEFFEVDDLQEGHNWELWQMAGARVKQGVDGVVEHCKRDVDRLQIITHRVKPLIKHIFKF